MSIQTSFETGKSKSTPSWLQRMATNLGFSSQENPREALERAIAEAGAEGEDPLSTKERLMLLNILGFGALRVAEVMVPRADIVAIGEDQPVAALLQLFASAGHSRIPVFRSSLDDPLGMVHIRDAVAWATAHGAPISAPLPEDSSGAAAHGTLRQLDFSLLDLNKTIAETQLVREVLFVPPSMSAVKLLAKMQARQIHLALVVDEFGGTDGLVSFEDLMEEIVGDIADEHDTNETLSIGFEDEAFVASARTPIEDVEHVLGLTLTARGATDEVKTLGGLILAIAGRVPKRGQIVEHPSGVTFEILDAGARRLHKIRIFRQLALPKPDDAGGAPLLLPPPSGFQGPISAPEKDSDLPDAKAA
jgi:CBS domain containing-hemolysin-like protein